MKTHISAGMFVLALSVSLSAGSAAAQSPAPVTPASPANQAGPASPSNNDGRWTPYLGCWRLLMENVRNQGIEDLIRSATQNSLTPAVTVCVQPAAGASSGVTMTTFAEGKRVLEQTVVADGAGHPVTESGCTGTQTSTWSHDGLRLFTRVEMACSNRPKQAISGITLFAEGPAWVDIQSMSADGDQQVRIRRYTRANEQPEGLTALPAAITARAIVEAQDASTRKLSQEDVAEASAKVSSPAVEAAIVETESRFNLNSRALIRLADAGVSPNVIDLMVAQSFPSHFTVERPITVPVTPLANVGLPPSGVPSAQYPMPYPMYPYGTYDPFYYYSYYYSPFAYPYYWGNGYYRGPTYYISNGNSTVITNGPGGSASPGSGTGSSDRGQVVNGRGYTRVHSGSEPDATTASPGQHTTTSPRTVRGSTPSGTDAGSSSSGSTGSTSSSGSSGSSGSTSSSGSGGVSSSGGYSGGGGDSGRTAQPR